MKRSTVVSSSKRRPLACRSACLILLRTPAPVRATGMEPRVPQKRMSIVPPVGHEEGASWALERRQCGQAQDILGTLAMIDGVIHERTDERNPQATYRTLGSVHREVWSWSGEHIEGNARINELNRKVSRLILHAADFDLAAAIRIGVETNIRQGLFDGEFDLHDTLGEKARSSGTLHHQRETAW